MSFIRLLVMRSFFLLNYIRFVIVKLSASVKIFLNLLKLYVFSNIYRLILLI